MGGPELLLFLSQENVDGWMDLNDLDWWFFVVQVFNTY